MLLTRLSLVPFLSFCAQIKFRKFGSCCQETNRTQDGYQRQIRTAATLSFILYYIQHRSGNVELT